MRGSNEEWICTEQMIRTRRRRPAFYPVPRVNSHMLLLDMPKCLPRLRRSAMVQTRFPARPNVAQTRLPHEVGSSRRHCLVVSDRGGIQLFACCSTKPRMLEFAPGDIVEKGRIVVLVTVASLVILEYKVGHRLLCSKLFWFAIRIAFQAHPTRTAHLHVWASLTVVIFIEPTLPVLILTSQTASAFCVSSARST